MGRAQAAARAGRNARSRAAGSCRGNLSANSTATRPASHSAHNSASGIPTAVSRLVQLPTAVSKKPAITATEKPNTISWACQPVAPRYAPGSSLPYSTNTHTGSVTTA